jgi:hypothetical protein
MGSKALDDESSFQSRDYLSYWRMGSSPSREPEMIHRSAGRLRFAGSLTASQSQRANAGELLRPF